MITFKELFPYMEYMNLDRNVERRKLVEEEFSCLGISPIRMPGVYVKGSGNTVVDGALGCMFAHREILENALRKGENVFIFEDDILFLNKKNIREIIDKACTELDEREWDMFYLSANILRPHYQISEHLSKLTHAQNTAGYGVHKSFVPILLDKYLPTIETIKQVWIDVIYADTVIPQHNCFITVPQLAVQRDGWSDIMNSAAQYSEYMQTRYKTYLIPLSKK